MNPSAVSKKMPRTTSTVDTGLRRFFDMNNVPQKAAKPQPDAETTTGQSTDTVNMTEINDNNPLAIPLELDRRHPDDVSEPADAVEAPSPGTSPDAGLDDDGACEEQEVLSATNNLEAHPYADLFPMMVDEDLNGLVVSIRDHGLEEPIVTHQGKILDGRNRAIACAKAGVDPEYISYSGTDALNYVMAKNVHRRNLSQSQRAMVAAAMTNLKVGEKVNAPLNEKSNGPNGLFDDAISTEMAATLLNVSPTTVKRAKQVLAAGDRDLIDAVKSGVTTVAKAAKQVTPKQQNTPAKNGDESDRDRIEKAWDRSGAGGREMFLRTIGAGLLPDAGGAAHE
jgi:ParB-like chromosome segregation protein Spo0J